MAGSCLREAKLRFGESRPGHDEFGAQVARSAVAQAKMTLLSRSGRGARLGLRHRQQAFALRELARRLLSPADAFLLLARLSL
jgi:hypothetical protein